MAKNDERSSCEHLVCLFRALHDRRARPYLTEDVDTKLKGRYIDVLLKPGKQQTTAGD